MGETSCPGSAYRALLPEHARQLRQGGRYPLLFRDFQRIRRLAGPTLAEPGTAIRALGVSDPAERIDTPELQAAKSRPRPRQMTETQRGRSKKQRDRDREAEADAERQRCRYRDETERQRQVRLECIQNL